MPVLPGGRFQEGGRFGHANVILESNSDGGTPPRDGLKTHPRRFQDAWRRPETSPRRSKAMPFQDAPGPSPRRSKRRPRPSQTSLGGRRESWFGPAYPGSVLLGLALSCLSWSGPGSVLLILFALVRSCCSWFGPVGPASVLGALTLT